MYQHINCITKENKQCNSFSILSGSYIVTTIQIKRTCILDLVQKNCSYSWKIIVLFLIQNKELRLINNTIYATIRP